MEVGTMLDKNLWGRGLLKGAAGIAGTAAPVLGGRGLFSKADCLNILNEFRAMGR
jgi:hypothetical protein